MTLLAQPLAFIRRHPWWTVFLAAVLLLLPTLKWILGGIAVAFRGWAEKLFGDVGKKIADWTENLLSKWLWILTFFLFLVPPLWPLAFVLSLWQAVDLASDKAGSRGEFTAQFNTAVTPAPASPAAPGVGDDIFNSPVIPTVDDSSSEATRQEYLRLIKQSGVAPGTVTPLLPGNDIFNSFNCSFN
jgi:hypothetical protein